MCDHGFIGACGECDGSGQVPSTEEPADGLDVDRRIDILWNVDARECGICETPAPPETASDPAWFMDSVMVEGVEMAIIRCPKCW